MNEKSVRGIGLFQKYTYFLRKTHILWADWRVIKNEKSVRGIGLFQKYTYFLCKTHICEPTGG